MYWCALIECECADAAGKQAYSNPALSSKLRVRVRDIAIYPSANAAGFTVAIPVTGLSWGVSTGIIPAELVTAAACTGPQADTSAYVRVWPVLITQVGTLDR